MDTLTEEELAVGLFELQNWSGDSMALRRSAECPSFPAAITAVDRIAVIAEEIDHHPDIDIRWRTLSFTVSTHSAGGVTALDLELARRIDEVIDNL
ncbi:MAG: 4a-hydroxytetrahydrobiopterin dehydratase [Actinomycetia bacterium]|nr:4a-hydroxytetrahydrobiopterin dehydratase [Actinomycetes bacterium]MCH9801434.1 4a-hydroxytetrahydrobiopterin dehydratase [Actinomycetes bacterium]